MSNPDQLHGTIAKGPLHAIHASAAVRDALLAYHDRPADDEAAAVVAAISAAIAPTEAAAMAATAPAGPVYWEFRWKDTHPQTVTSGQWYPWEKVEPRNGSLETVESRLAELRDYIAQGKCYEIRALYTQDPVAGQPAEPSPAARDVLAERARQIGMEGWDLARDDRYVHGELSAAAAAYIGWTHGEYVAGEVPINWPWSPKWFKPTDVRRNLVKAAALTIAEIERLDRAAPKGDSNG